MKNMADAIESFIVGQLLAASKNTVLVQRNELADRLSCAPSQISYVLSTRFTPEKGYLRKRGIWWNPAGAAGDLSVSSGYCLWKNSRKNRL